MRHTLTAIKEHRAFEGVISAIIVLSALTVGLKTYDLSPEIYSLLVTLDNIVTGIFILEIALRYLTARSPREYFSSGWNWFDIIVVTASLMPFGDSAQVARIIRVLRIMRIISFLPRLRILIATFFEVLPETFYLVALNIIFFYIYAVVGHSAFSSINPELWGDLGRSMLTLFRVMTLEGWTQVMYETNAEYSWSWFYYVSFILITAIICLNLLVGVVVQVLDAQTREHAPQQTCPHCGKVVDDN